MTPTGTLWILALLQKRTLFTVWFLKKKSLLFIAFFLSRTNGGVDLNPLDCRHIITFSARYAELPPAVLVTIDRWRDRSPPCQRIHGTGAGESRRPGSSWTAGAMVAGSIAGSPSRVYPAFAHQ